MLTFQKELIWSMWPPGELLSRLPPVAFLIVEWTAPAQPPSAQFIRVLHAGRVLSDDSTLSCKSTRAHRKPVRPEFDRHTHRPCRITRKPLISEKSAQRLIPANNLPSSLTPAKATVIHISVRSFSIRAEDGELRRVRIVGSVAHYRRWRKLTCRPEEILRLGPSRVKTIKSSRRRRRRRVQVRHHVRWCIAGVRYFFPGCTRVPISSPIAISFDSHGRVT